MVPTVSIITPTFNSERYVEQTIASVLDQSFDDWEMVIVDDCSTDGTYTILEQFAARDQRIRVFRQEVNQGAGPARTRAAQEAKGRFVAYLDADDIWYPNKLETQVKFMKANGYGFTCASYEVIDNAGVPLNKYVHMLPEVDYIGFLTNNLLQTVGIMVDTTIVDPELLNMPSMKRRQDAATWLQILRAGHTNYGVPTVLAQYRRADDSLSSSRIKAAKAVWRLYRDVEKLPVGFSVYCFSRYAVLAVWKRTYSPKPLMGARKWQARRAQTSTGTVD